MPAIHHVGRVGSNPINEPVVPWRRCVSPKAAAPLPPPQKAPQSTVLATPKQTIDRRDMTTPSTPAKQEQHKGTGTPRTRRRQLNRQCARLRRAAAAELDAPFTARELLAELDVLADRPDTVSGPTEKCIGSRLYANAGAQASWALPPPWHAQPTSLSRRLVQYRLCTAKLHRLLQAAQSMLVPGTKLASLSAILSKVTTDLQLSSHVANTTGSAVWRVVLSEYRCALLLALANASAGPVRGANCRLLLRDCAAACRSLWLSVERSRVALDDHIAMTLSREPPVSADVRESGLAMQLGLRVLELRLLRHLALVAAVTNGAEEAWSAADVYVQAVALSNGLLALLSTTYTPDMARPLTAQAPRWTALSSVFLLAVQSLLELIFWLPGETQTRLELLHDAAALLLFRRLHCCAMDWHAAPDADGAIGVLPRTVPEFMADLLRFFASNVSTTPPPPVARGATPPVTCEAVGDVIGALLGGREVVDGQTRLWTPTVSTPGLDVDEISDRGEVTGAYVYTCIRSEDDLFMAMESDEEDRLGLTAFLRQESSH